MMTEELAPGLSIIEKLSCEKLMCADLTFSVPPSEEKKSEEPKLITMSHAELMSNQLGSKDLSRKLLTDLGINEETLKKNPRRCD
jgi:hypothetical protein